MKYRELYEEGLKALCEAMPDNPDRKLDARLLLESACGTTHETLLVYSEREVAPEQETEYRRMIERRCGREPVAYILGEQDFMGLPFRVTKDVLIPNQDTENLVEETLKEVRDGMKILDLCTGSGCILLSLLHYAGGTTGIGTDLSPAALHVAQANGEALGLTARVRWRRGDLFGALGTERKERFDIIVSNPPYIPTAVIGTLMPEVAREEPRMALDGGEDGLMFYRRIINEAPLHLAAGGILIMETGFDEAAEVSALMESGGFTGVRVMKDYGGQDRVVRGELAASVM